MNRVICYPNCCVPTTFDDDVWYFELFSYPEYRSQNIGFTGATLFKELRKAQITPTATVLDFVIIALSVVSADKAILRKESPDGWTREIELTVYIHEVDKWNSVKDKLEWMLRFLTGDFWSLKLLELPQSLVPMQSYPERKGDCICLLSGGVDSLVGAIDLSEVNRIPVFVSQIVRGDAKHQRDFARHFGENNLCQWRCNIKKNGASENSTRARSIVFFAYALLATCGIKAGKNGRKEIFIPENGFISLNTPLDSSRIGSLSTKTTHPIYMASLQDIWDRVGLEVDLVLPYKYKTKGEVLKECKNQELLIKTVFDSTSCGKFQRHGLRHCGTCVPCLVRRAAFLKAGLSDKTVKGYKGEDLKNAQSKDIAAAAMAVMQEEQCGIESVVKSSLSFADSKERKKFLGVISRGIGELRELLRKQEII
ncbi:MAG: Qat anti-phage system QueC-like protein QatC [Lachnospiraceae bacterium]